MFCAAHRQILDKICQMFGDAAAPARLRARNDGKPAYQFQLTATQLSSLF